jgi:chromosomal replication initiator protein
MSLPCLWDSIKATLKEKIGAASYETWFSCLNIKEIEGELVLETPDAFYKNWIIENYIKTLEEITAQQAPNVSIKITTNPEESSVPTATVSTDPLFVPVKKPGEASRLNLNSRFSFDNFVVGSSNRFAFAASQAVAESPAKSYNPLFLYSHVGLGKTHLMQSIAHEIKKRHPELKCVYLSSETFTNELINAIRHRSTDQFREKYRNIDVLLIDDIHFIAGKESTQEEFFHTFNTLHNSHKQIIISSDRPPKEITNLEDRLSSRFAWGLIADIQPPDFETRVAILKKKLEREPIVVPDEVISFIADQIKTNIRELEGALIRVVAYSLLEEKPISLAIAKIVLKDMVKETTKTISIDMIQKEISSFFEISVSDIKSKKRSRNVILPRQVSMFLARKLTNLSLPEIGAAFGGKDHTTVMHSCRKIEIDMEKDGDLKKTIEKLITLLQQ